MFDFNNKVAHVGGWLTEAEGLFLYTAAKNCVVGHIVEIGSWKGKSTICLASGAKVGMGQKVIAIDPHIGSSEHQKKFGKLNTFEEFKHNINRAEVAEFVTPIVNTSERAAKNFSEPVGVIFIDGAHEFSMVRLDFKVWFPKVINGGIVAFHDSWHFIGVNMATAIILCTSAHVRCPRLVDTITYVEKVARNRWRERLENIGFVIYRTFCGLPGFLRLKYRGHTTV